MKRTLARTVTTLAIAIAATTLVGCSADRYPDESTATPAAKKSVINSGSVNVPETSVFWQDIGDGYKIRCIWGEDQSSSYTGSLSCDWVNRVKN